VDFPPGKILVAVDGEPHTEAAVKWAIALAAGLERPLVALHVKDPYLKQFAGEIYAQGRREYLEHVDSCLQEQAEKAAAGLAAAVGAADRPVAWTIKVRQGDPAEELLAEARGGGYCLLVLGGKELPDRIGTAGRLQKWRSGKLARGLPPDLEPEMPVLVFRSRVVAGPGQRGRARSNRAPNLGSSAGGGTGP